MKVIVRPATPEDLERLGALAGALVRLHHRTDPQRFLLVEDVERGYAGWFGRELRRPERAVLLVAVRLAAAPDAGDAVVGYAYGTLEERDWNMLLDAHGALHDIFLEEGARAQGAGQMLVAAMITRLEKLGAKRVVLSTMVSNASAQRLFAKCGFRPTMLEMSR